MINHLRFSLLSTSRFFSFDTHRVLPASPSHIFLSICSSKLTSLDPRLGIATFHLFPTYPGDTFQTRWIDILTLLFIFFKIYIDLSYFIFFIGDGWKPILGDFPKNSLNFRSFFTILGRFFTILGDFRSSGHPDKCLGKLKYR